jgi:NitT/TauT family transport system permease protein
MSRDLALGTAAATLTALAAIAVLARIDAGLAGRLDLLVTAGLFVTAWIALQRLAPLPRAGRLVPALFGIWLLFLWEAGTRGFAVPPVLLPPPSAVARALVANHPILAQDFIQTVLREVLPGWAIGCGAGFLTAVLIDRSPFLQRGLVPVGNLVSALPIVGIAPIMVMWFGFDWPSKVAVVVVMTFFPMLVSAQTGLQTAGRLEQDLLRTYAASYPQTLLKLRLPAALPFIFNALKLNSTLALIGAIVAEFFGTPIVGMGFRISTEVGRMSLDVVWATIVVAAVTGSLFYGLLALLERALTFWHASYRARDVPV